LLSFDPRIGGADGWTGDGRQVDVVRRGGERVLTETNHGVRIPSAASTGRDGAGRRTSARGVDDAVVEEHLRDTAIRSHAATAPRASSALQRRVRHESPRARRPFKIVGGALGRPDPVDDRNLRRQPAASRGSGGGEAGRSAHRRRAGGAPPTSPPRTRGFEAGGRLSSREEHLGL